jgi:hypothetical protein
MDLEDLAASALILTAVLRSCIPYRPASTPCLRRNTQRMHPDKAAIAHKLPDRTADLNSDFMRCPTGGRVYLEGLALRSYERHRHGAFATPGGLQSRSLEQQWLTRFDGRGFSVIPDGASRRWRLELAGMTGNPS